MKRPKRYYQDMNPMKASLIRELYFVGRLRQREIAKGFGLTQGSVSRIVSGQVWAA